MMRTVFSLFCFFIITPISFALDFHGYYCTADCSGHRAGYEWAARRGITMPEQCNGYSRSFIEGCIAWASEHAPDDEEDDDIEDD